jgi:hypothetical protein
MQTVPFIVLVRSLVYLQVTSAKNNLKVRLRRLKQPKYLLGAVVGLGYFGFYFGQTLFWRFGMRRQMTDATWAGDQRDLMIGFGSVLLVLYAVGCWLLPGSRAAVQFTETELAFLLPAPLTRRSLIHFKLLKSQVPLLMTSVFFALLGGWASGGSWLYRCFGWWSLLFTLNLHGLGASFTLTRLLDKGLTPWPRRFVILVVFSSVATALGWWAWAGVPGAPTVDASAEEWQTWLSGALTGGPLFHALSPFRWVIAPWFARSAPEFFFALPASLGLLALHYVWVLSAEVSFEEASLAAARRNADLIATIRAGRNPLLTRGHAARRPFFRLAATGFAPVALLWKNLISASFVVNRRLLIFVSIWVVMVAAMLSGTLAGGAGLTIKTVVSLVSLVALGATAFLGPQLLRGDFRQDYECIDVLKMYPMPGWQVVLGQLLAPALMLTAVQWGLISILVAASDSVRVSRVMLDLETRLSIAACIGLMLPGFNLLSYVIPNALVLLFPAWTQSGREGPGGVEVMGQRLLVALGTGFVVFIGLAPAALIFFLIFSLVTNLGMDGAETLAFIAGGAGGLGVFIVESAVAIFLLGKVFDRFDLTHD